MTFFLGLTGGIASGKSTADEILKEKGITIVDCDQIAHELLEPGAENWQNIEGFFGPSFFKPNAELDRIKLGQFVFQDKKMLAKLNELTHPAINREVERQKQAAKSDICVVDMPLLFESDSQNQFDATLLIYVPKEMQIQRLMQRNNFTQEEANARVNSQMSTEEKLRLATYAVENTGTIESLSEKLEAIIKKIEV